MGGNENSKKMILVMDDDSVIRLVIRGLLNEFNVVTASEGSEGWKKFHTEMPDLVILDLNLPGKTGFEILQEREKRSDLSHIPVLVISQLNDRKSICMAVGYGADDFILKPLDYTVFREKCYRLLREVKDKSYRFKETERPEVKLRARGIINHPTPMGIMLESPIKFTPGTRIDVQSPSLEPYTQDHLVFKKTPQESKMLQSGAFISEILVAGANPANHVYRKES